MPKGKVHFLYLSIIAILTCNQLLILAEQYAKDNGDIYVVADDKANNTSNEPQTIDLEEIMSTCNSSFSIPMDSFLKFNTTGDLPDIVDKTGPCYIRCYFEKSGFIDNWKVNADRIRQYLWPATGDSIEVCQEEGKDETNACLHAYAIAKCLMIRAIVDARSTPPK